MTISAVEWQDVRARLANASLNTATYATLSQYAYGTKGTPLAASLVAPPAGWEIVRASPASETNGYKAIAFKHKATNTVVIVNAGTDGPISDWLGTNLINSSESQIAASIEFYKSVAGTNLGPIIVTGHSLGGALAEAQVAYAAFKGRANVSGFGFHSASLSGRIIDYLAFEEGGAPPNITSRMVHYQSEADVVFRSGYGSNFLGSTIALGGIYREVLTSSGWKLVPEGLATHTEFYKRILSGKAFTSHLVFRGSEAEERLGVSPLGGGMTSRLADWSDLERARSEFLGVSPGWASIDSGGTLSYAVAGGSTINIANFTVANARGVTRVDQTAGSTSYTGPSPREALTGDVTLDEIVVTAEVLPGGLRRIVQVVGSPVRWVVESLSSAVGLIVNPFRGSSDRSSADSYLLQASAGDNYLVGGPSDDNVGADCWYPMLTGEPADSQAFWLTYGSQFAGSLGTTLGRVLGGDNQFLSQVSGQVLSTVAESLAQRIAAGSLSRSADLSQNISQLVLDSIGDVNLSLALGSAAVGTISSFLTAEFADALNLDGTAAEVFGVLGGTVLNVAVNNVAASLPILSQFDFQRIEWRPGVEGTALPSLLGTAIGAYFGSKLASTVISPNTQGVAIWASINSAFAAKAGFAVGNALGGPVVGAITATIAAFVNHVVNTFFGNLFFKKKVRTTLASAESELLAASGLFTVSNPVQQGGGNIQLVTSMAEAASETLNKIIDTIDGTVDTRVGLLAQKYGHRNGNLYVNYNGTEIAAASADEAVEKGVIAAAKELKVLGGDIYVKRMLSKSLSQNVTSWAGDLAIALDYRFYVASREHINSIIAAEPTSAFSAGWLVVLQRADELGLGDFAASDFFGGVRGFLGSFALEAKGLGFEDVSVALNGADLQFSLLGQDPPTGLFSILPQASGEGRSLAVAGFLGAGLGYSAWDATAAVAGANLIDASGASAGQVIDDYALVGGIAYSGGDDIAIGSAYGDTLQGRTGWDWLDGGGGADLVMGGQDQDVLLGGQGDDSLYGDLGDDYVSGGSGDDDAYGGSGNDVLVGNAGADIMYGEDGDDLFIVEQDGGAVADFMDGGAGSDTLSFERFSAPVSFSLTNPFYGDGWASIEGLTGSKGADSLAGDAFANILRGLKGNDTLSGSDGNDTLEGGAGADFLVGGAGVDTVSYARSSDGVHVDLITLQGGGGDADGDTYSSVQNVIGSEHGDVLRGCNCPNLLHGEGGNDLFFATGGTDTYDGGGGQDFVDYSDAAAGVTLNIGGYTGATFVSGAGTAGIAASHTFVKIEGVIGSDHADNLAAGDGAQVLGGGKGDDALSGGAGADTYLFNLGDGQDTITEDSAGWNTLSLGEGILFQDLILGTAGGSGGFLDVYIRGTTDKVRVTGNWADANVPKIKTLELNGVAQLDLDQALNAVAASDNADTMIGVDGFGDLLFGANGDDVMAARSSGVEQVSHVFVGGLGQDLMFGSTGDDSYGVDRAGSAETDYISDAGGEDTLVFGPSVAAEDVIYEVESGGALFISARDAANPALTASQVATRVHVAEGGTQYYNTLTGQSQFAGGMVEFVTAGGATIDLRKLDIAWNVIEYSNYENYAPIILDLDGDGLDLSSIDETQIVAKTANGTLSRVAWAGPTDGFLAVDRNGDGAINRLSEISFTQDKVGAKTDLEGLTAWDTNGDGVLNESDKDWDKLLVWTDRNQNGRSTKGELRSLKQAGITSIDLKGQGTGYTADLTEESFVQNTLSFATKDGKGGTAYDVALARRLVNSEGLYAGAYQTSWGKLDEDGELGRMTNDAKADAKAKTGAGEPTGKGVKAKTLSYDAVAAAAKVDFKDSDDIDAKVAKAWEHKLDPAKAAEWKARQQLGPTDQAKIDALVKTKADAAKSSKGGASPVGIADDEEALAPARIAGGDVMAAASATSGNDSITGTTGADTLEGLGGNDTIAGLAGSDRYIFSGGDGDDKIVEVTNTGATDKIVFGTGLLAANLVVTRSTSDADDVTLSFTGSAGSVLLDEQFASGSYGLEQIQFGDGAVWSKTDLINAYTAQSQTSGNDTIFGVDGSTIYTFSALAGADEIREPVHTGDVDKLVLGAGLNPGNLVLTRGATDLDDVTLSFTGSAGSVMLDNQFKSSSYGMEQIQFGDGTLWTRADLINGFITRAMTSGNDTINGFEGSTTYTYSALAGDDEIRESIHTGTTDRLVLGAGLDASKLRVLRSTTDLNDVTLSFTGVAGSIKLDGQYHPNSYGMEEVQFGDGVVWGRVDLINAYIVQTQTVGNDTIQGFAGSTTYNVASIAGHDQILESINTGATDILIFGPGLNSTNVTVTRTGDDATLSFAGSTGSLKLIGQFYSSKGFEEIRFADGVVWTKANFGVTGAGLPYTAGPDTLTGVAAVNDSLRGGGGNDRLEGLTGSDTYTYDPGDGEDLIVEAANAGDTDKLVLTCVKPDEIAVTRDDDDLIVRFLNYGGSVRVTGGAAGAGAGIETYEFDGGVVRTAAQMIEIAGEEEEPAGGMALAGGDAEEPATSGSLSGVLAETSSEGLALTETPVQAPQFDLANLAPQDLGVDPSGALYAARLDSVAGPMGADAASSSGGPVTEAPAVEKRQDHQPGAWWRAPVEGGAGPVARSLGALLAELEIAGPQGLKAALAQTQDPEAARRQQLLRQAMAGFVGPDAGMPAVWSRGADAASAAPISGADWRGTDRSRGGATTTLV